MQSKHLLIAIAAFAVTATGAQAYVGSDRLTKAGLSSQQVQAFSQARELRMKGEVGKAKDVLLEAGVDEDFIRSIRKIAHESHQKIQEAVEAGDYEAFKEAVAGTKLGEVINTEEDFLSFKEVHLLKQAGNFGQAQIILDGLDLSETMEGYVHKQPHPHQVLLDLTPQQHDALRVAKQANDRDTVKAILVEAGVLDSYKHHHIMHKEWQ